MKIGKYEFNSKQQFEEKVLALGVSTDEEGNEYPTHKHIFVELGNLILEPAIYSEEGEEVTPAVLSDKYHVDAAWDLEDSYDEEGELVKAKHPHGWASYSVELTSNGSHSFYGIDYLANKI